MRLGAQLALIVGATLLLAQPASAATVVNGDFETGTLAGWSQAEVPFPGGEGWFAYSGTAAPVSTEEGEEKPRTVQAPPQGNFAAISDENGPGTHILYQDIALAPGMTHTLSLIAYYNSEAPITVPTLDTLSSEGAENQQYRIDVMRAGAPIESVNPADILATVFSTGNGAPQSMGPTTFSVDLTPFAGQTVRLRLAEVDNLFFFNAGVDAVAVQSIPSNNFTIGKLKLNRKNGTAKLKVTVPGPGKLTAVDVKKKGKRIKSTVTAATAAGVAILKLKPTSKGRKTLENEGRLHFKVRVSFTPTGGLTANQSRGGTLGLKLGGR
jgi:hypothetical protein